MAARKNNQIIITACLKILQLFEFVAIIYNTFEDEFVLGKSACFIEGDCVCSASKWNLFGLADKDLLFLKV